MFDVTGKRDIYGYTLNPLKLRNPTPAPNPKPSYLLGCPPRPPLPRTLTQLPPLPPPLPPRTHPSLHPPHPKILPPLPPIKHLPPPIHRLHHLLPRNPNLPLPPQLPLLLLIPSLTLRSPALDFLNRNKHLLHPPQIPRKILLETPRHKRPRGVPPREEVVRPAGAVEVRRGADVVDAAVQGDEYR